MVIFDKLKILPVFTEGQELFLIRRETYRNVFVDESELSNHVIEKIFSSVSVCELGGWEFKVITSILWYTMSFKTPRTPSHTTQHKIISTFPPLSRVDRR